MPTSYTRGEWILISCYRVLRLSTLIAWMISFAIILALPNETEAQFANRIFVMLLGIAVVAPVFHGFLFRSDEPYHLFVFAGGMTIFSSFGLLSAPELSKALTLGWGIVFAVGLLAYVFLKSRQEKTERAYRHIDRTPQTVQISRSEQPTSSPTWQRWQTYIDEINQYIDQFERYTQALQPQLVRGHRYLLKLTAQSTYAEDPTTKGLVETLTRRMGHQQLLIDWLVQVIQHFRQDVQRLEEQQDSLEVANFLQDKPHLNALLLTEQSAWDQDLYHEVNSIVHALTQLDPAMTLQTQDLPANLQTRVEQSLLTLKG